MAREQLAPRRADAGREVVGLQQHGAGGAQVGVERVVPLFLALELLGRHVGRGRGLARFGRELRQALRRRGEPRREIRDHPLKSEAERIVLGFQGLEIGVGEILVLERRLGGGERRARLVEIERVRVLRPSPPERHEDEGENGPVQQAQCGLRLHRRPSDHGRASPATCPLHHAFGVVPSPAPRGRIGAGAILPCASARWRGTARSAVERAKLPLPRQLRIHFASGKGLRA